MPGIKKAGGPHKYNKVNQQKKYHLLTLFYKRSLSLRQAAQIAGVNYLTAKTILFFHKNNHRSYQFGIHVSQTACPQPKTLRTASYTSCRNRTPFQPKFGYQEGRIQIVCSIGNVSSQPNKNLGCQKDVSSSHQSISASIKKEQFDQISQKPARQAPLMHEKTPSQSNPPSAHSQEEVNLKLGLAGAVEQAAKQVLYWQGVCDRNNAPR